MTGHCITEAESRHVGDANQACVVSDVLFSKGVAIDLENPFESFNSWLWGTMEYEMGLTTSLSFRYRISSALAARKVSWFSCDNFLRAFTCSTVVRCTSFVVM